MIGTTSDHIKPCNIGQSEAHNRRTPEYMAHINADRLYIRTDLMGENQQWISSSLSGMSLQDYYDQIAIMVKQKTGRAMQVKDRERKDKKTGRVKIIRGSSPLRESVVVCDEHTTIDKLRLYTRLCKERFGITPLQIFLHRDEGHYANPSDPESWKPNYHAHIVWDWMDHNTGKSLKLDANDMSKMQDILSLALGMNRGKSKEVTGAEHLERTDFIVAKQKQESKEAIAIKQEAEQAAKLAIAQSEQAISQINDAKAEHDSLSQQAIVKDQEILALDRLISQKRALAQQSGESIEIQRLNEMLNWRNDLLTMTGNFLYSAWAMFKRAVDAVIRYTKSCFNVMDTDDAIAVKDVMDVYAGNKGNRIAVGNLIVHAAGHLGQMTESQYHKAHMEVDGVADGLYDNRIRRDRHI